MPNYVEHDMVVTGPAEELERFAAFAAEGKEALSANKFIPYPQRCRDADARIKRKTGFPEAFSDEGYNWCVENWGAKWGIHDSKRVESVASIKQNGRASIAYTFESAWSPALQVIRAMSEQFSGLRFEVKYFEQGMGFSGHYIFLGGVVIVGDHDKNYRGTRGG